MMPALGSHPALRAGAAAAALAATIAIGLAVSHAPLSAFDAGELGQYGLDTPPAAFLTAAGRFPTYLMICVAALIFGIVRRAWLMPAIVGVVGTVAVWKSSDFLKLQFARPRPPHPIIAEASWSYPSGHADQALFVYAFLAWCVWQSGAPRSAKIAVASLAAVWVLAIGWSRLALGAHYPTDILGGWLFGAGWFFAAAATVGYLRTRTHGPPPRSP